MNAPDRTPDDLERTEELFRFLQGTIPDGYRIHKRKRPRLTPDQAWTVIWYLGNLYWQVTDHVERCDVCGTLYDAHREGATLDYGRPPHFFCESCEGGEAYAAKLARAPKGSGYQEPQT